MRVLVFTNMYPTDDAPFYGSFVRDEVEALKRAGVDVDVYFVNGRASKRNYAGMPSGFASNNGCGAFSPASRPLLSVASTSSGVRPMLSATGRRASSAASRSSCPAPTT